MLMVDLSEYFQWELETPAHLNRSAPDGASKQKDLQDENTEQNARHVGHLPITRNNHAVVLL